MSSLPTIVPISELRSDAAGVIKRAAASQEPVVITQKFLADADTLRRVLADPTFGGGAGSPSWRTL